MIVWSGRETGDIAAWRSRSATDLVADCEMLVVRRCHSGENRGPGPKRPAIAKGTELADDRPERLAKLAGEQAARLVLFARQRCDTPEDVVQEAFLKLFQQKPWPDDPVGWLYRVVRNLGLNAGRERNRRASREGRVAHEKPGWFQSSPGSQLDGQQASAALARLDAETRETIVLRIWCDHSFAAIGELTGTSAATALRRFRAGLEELRLALEGRAESEGRSPRSLQDQMRTDQVRS
jgi:RNA polymerase sigma factor (sigma-70 family)